MDRRQFMEIAGVTTAAAVLGLMMRGADSAGQAMSNPSPGASGSPAPTPTPTPSATPRRPSESDHIMPPGTICAPHRTPAPPPKSNKK